MHTSVNAARPFPETAMRNARLAGSRCRLVPESVKLATKGTAPPSSADAIPTSYLLGAWNKPPGRPQDNPTLARAVVGLGLRLHVERGRMAEATALAQTPDADPADVFWLGSKLAAAGQLTEARSLLSGACPQLQDDSASRCSTLLGQLGGP